MRTAIRLPLHLLSRDYVAATRALQLSSVPLDVAYSLQSMRSAFGGSAYTARALQNSRRLLALYLAGSTKLPDTFTSGVSVLKAFDSEEEKQISVLQTDRITLIYFGCLLQNLFWTCYVSH